MAKSRGFSIYLLKESFNAQNALLDEHGMQLMEINNTVLPPGSVMYLADNFPKQPWWKEYWGLTIDLYQVQKGAIVFLQVNKRWIALTFGMSYHRLKDESYEYDFGLRTTLNALDPKKIKSTDVLQPENARRERIQSPVDSELTFFDFNQDESIIRKLTGKVKLDYKNWFTNVTGSSNLRITSKVTPEEMIDLCTKILNVYDSKEYLSTFPNIQNVVPVKDPDLLNILNLQLTQAFLNEVFDLVLTIPEILDYSISCKIKYSGAGKSVGEFDEVYISDYRSYLAEKGKLDSIDIEMFKQHKLVIIDENGDASKKFAIYNCFLFDYEDGQNHYHLCDGEWYKIEKQFLRKLTSTLDPYFMKTHPILLSCNEKKEEDYNKRISKAYNRVYNLDKENISPNGQYPIEPCDLLYINAKGVLEFVHVKISTRSFNLSHLFNQGYNSTALIQIEHESREKLKKLVNDSSISQLIESKNICVVLGIITKKPRENRSKNLPIFSRISLFRIVKSFNMMNIQISLYFIEDNMDRKKIAQKKNNK